MQRLLVPIGLVRVKPKKLRKLHPTKVAQYERDYEQGDDFPPIEVEDCGSFYTVRDGRHRYIAQYNLGYAMIDVLVVRGGGAVVVKEAWELPLCYTALAAICFAQSGEQVSALV